ncbi:MAG TPA: GEVED domain-containing protein [Flavisolibacter sp.]
MKRILLFATLVVSAGSQLLAQCSTANINWDNLDYLVTTGNYAGFVTAAQSSDQRFAFGRSAMRVQVTSNITINGANGTHTGSTNTFGTGNDVAYVTTTTAGTSTITLSFDDPISNLQFSLYDIDNNQRVNVTATNGATPVSTTLSIASGSLSLTTFAPATGNNPRANGIATDYAVTDNRGAVNVSITGAVTSVILTFANATGDFWLSDFQGCVPGAFATNYYAPSQPWPNQPSYMLATSDTNLVHTLNPATGAVKKVFHEPAAQYVNSLGYDPYNKILYYTLDDVNAAVTQKAIKKFDFETETITTLVPDVTAIGIPLFETGVESGGGAYYDSCFYIGIEGGNAGRTSNRKSIVWRVEFNSSGVPVSASQVFAILVDNGSGNLLHDWADFVIKDGILYNWNSRVQSGGSYRVYQYNLQTEVLTTHTTTWGPKQNGITWDGKIYQIGTTLQEYNGTTGLIGSAVTISGPGWIGGSGDATEGYKPKADYGDAPSSYDPAASPAVHEYDSLLRLGNTFDKEWSKVGATSFADADGTDEDGVATTPILCPCSGNFFVPVRVFNNSGANATLIAWLDYDGDGVFESTEALSATVGSSASMQTINLNWTNAWSFIPDNSFTYLRIRLTSTANGMTTSAPAGYFANGEVEDYRVLVDGFPLAVNILAFNAAKDANGIGQISWKVAEDAEISHYYVQKSTTGKDWINIATKTAASNSTTVNYQVEDANLQDGITYYRLQLTNKSGASRLSDVRQITTSKNSQIKLTPNPVLNKASLQFVSGASEKSTLKIINAAGTIVKTQEVAVRKGFNAIEVYTSELAAGLYTVELITTKGRIVEHFVKQ